ncbi:MAG: beta-ketoacyl-[acyl-carrier-protein] synthase family protein [Myxococcales bacterium]|nr:beta-ketoacyl-[acyl-carrier-protein] synthase family protein [Myxococcales bacterium]
MARVSDPLIAITGLGLVCPLGNDVPTALARASRGERAIRAYTSPWVDATHPRLHQRVGGTVVDFDAARWLEPRFAERQEPAVLYALAAAAEALTQAGLADAGDRDRIGCVVGAGLAGAELWHRALHTAYGADRPDGIARMAAIAITGTAATGLLAIRHQLRGPSIGLANACASGTSAIVVGADQIRLGRADAMLVGGCESSMRSLLAYASFVDAGMNPTTEPVGACTPFAAGRKGFVLAEGAGMLVLERLDAARARGAEVLAVLAGSALANDAYHVISPDPTGAAWARVIRAALADAGVDASQVDAVSAHATATPQGDVAETRAIHAVLGARAPRVPVSATKSMHGHAFGAAGAIETALAVAAMRAGLVLPTIDLATADPDCDLDYVPHRARRHPVRVLVKHGFGAGGVSSALVLRHGDDVDAPLRARPAPTHDQFAF